MKNKKGKVLVYISSARKIILKSGEFHNTGIFLGELTEVLKPLLDEYQIEFVSPNGKRGEIDPISRNLKYWGFKKERLVEAEQLLWSIRKLGMETPMDIRELLKDQNKLKEYDMIFIPGGHSMMNDIVFENWGESEKKNIYTSELLSFFHNHKKIIGLICHSTSALAAIETQPWPFKDYNMTCISMLSEHLTEDLPLFKTVQGHLKSYPANMLKEKGGKVVNSNIPMKSLVIEDRQLITGQDPYSGTQLGQKVKIKLDKYIEEKNKSKEEINK